MKVLTGAALAVLMTEKFKAVGQLSDKANESSQEECKSPRLKSKLLDHKGACDGYR